MRWAFQPPDAAPAPTPNLTPTPISSGGSSGGGGISSTPAAPTDPNAPGMVSLNLTSPQPLSSHQAPPGGGFGGGLIGQGIGAVTGVIGGAVAVPGILANLADKVIGAGVNLALNDPTGHQQADIISKFQQEPDSPEKQAAQAEMAQHTGDANAIAQIAFAHLDRTHAYLMPEISSPIDSTASGIAMHMLGLLQVPQQAIERGVAGIVGNVKIDPLSIIGGVRVESFSAGDRLDNIQERLKNPATAADVTPTEQWAADQVAAHKWNKNQALDYLAGHGAGFSSDPATEIIGALISDPTVLLPAGGALMHVAGVGTHLAAAAADGSRVASSALKVAGLVNDIVDPVGAMFGRASHASLLPDAQRTSWNVAAGLSDDLGGRVAGMTTAGYHGAYNWAGNIYEHMARLGAEVNGRFLKDVSSSVANMTRRSLTRRYVATLTEADKGKLLQFVPDDVIGGLIAKPPKNLTELVERDAMGVMKPVETDAEKLLLAERASRAYGQTPEQWLETMKGWSAKDISFLHAQTYSNEQAVLLDTIQRLVDSPEWAATGSHIDPKRLILMNAGTLTEPGAKRLVRSLNKLATDGADTEAAAQLLRDAQAIYPDLRGLAKLDAASNDLSSQVAHIQDYLERRVYQGGLPGELSPAEIARLKPHAPELADMHERALSGDAPWKLGMAPAQDGTARWGLVYDSEGKLHSVMDAWVTHVSAGASSYQPLSAPLRFVNGEMAGFLSNKVANVVDGVQNLTQMMTHSVTAALVTENAKVRFLTEMRRAGMVDAEGKKVFQGVVDLITDRQAPIRSLGKHDIWSEVKHLIPLRMQGEMTGSDFMAVILKAYQGDLRIVGATQYLTGGLKRVGVLGAENNNLGILAERIVPFLRFRVSPVFQAQQRIEGVFWNLMRGTVPAFGTRLAGGAAGETDRLLMDNLKELAATSGRRPSDQDAMVEMSIQAQGGHSLGEATKQGRFRELWDNITNARGAEQLNYLRAVKSELHAGMKRSLEGSGLNFDEVIQSIKDRHASAQTGSRWGDSRVVAPLSDDDAAVRYWYEMMDQQAKPGEVVQPGERVVNMQAEASLYAPTNIGELKAVDVDGFLAKSPIRIAGDEIKSADDLKRAIRYNRISMRTMEEHLTELNVPPENIARFQRRLSFDYNVFWRDAAKKFNLTRQETTDLQGMVNAVARRQGMAPADFLSQVLSPDVSSVVDAQARVVKLGTKEALTAKIAAAGKDVLPEDKALMGHIGNGLSLLRAAKDGSATAEDLTRQLSQVFVANLHPSMQETLLAEFEKLPEQVAAAAADNMVLPVVHGGWNDPVAAAAAAAAAPAVTTPIDNLSKAILDRAASGTAHANPEIERAFQEFSRWSQEAIGGSLLKSGGASPQMTGLLEKLKLIPTDHAQPFNVTQSLHKQALLDYLAQKENDAFSLLYWRRSRTFAERSINHPMFGLYPASYMWGKVAPNFLKFLALEPFGLKTAAPLNALRNTQMVLAARREFDPNFQAAMDGLAKDKVGWFAQYLLPGSPWDLGASAPGWARELLKQSEANAKLVAAGKEAKPLDFGALLKSEADYMNPGRSLDSGLAALSELERGVESVVNKPPAAPDFNVAVPASGLQPYLSPQLQSLRDLLTH